MCIRDRIDVVWQYSIDFWQLQYTETRSWKVQLLQNTGLVWKSNIDYRHDRLYLVLMSCVRPSLRLSVCRRLRGFGVYSWSMLAGYIRSERPAGLDQDAFVLRQFSTETPPSRRRKRRLEIDPSRRLSYRHRVVRVIRCGHRSLTWSMACHIAIICCSRLCDIMGLDYVFASSTSTWHYRLRTWSLITANIIEQYYWDGLPWLKQIWI